MSHVSSGDGRGRLARVFGMSSDTTAWSTLLLAELIVIWALALAAVTAG